MRTCLFTSTPFSSALFGHYRSLSFPTPTHLGQLTAALLLLFGLCFAHSFVGTLCFARVNRASTTILLIFRPLSRSSRSLSVRPPSLFPAPWTKFSNFHRHFSCLFRGLVTYFHFSSLALCLQRFLSLIRLRIALVLHLVSRVISLNDFCTSHQCSAANLSVF